MTYTFRQGIGSADLDDVLAALGGEQVYRRYAEVMDLRAGVRVRSVAGRIKVQVRSEHHRGDFAAPLTWLIGETATVTQEFTWSRYGEHIVGRLLVTSTIRSARFTGIIAIAPAPTGLAMTLTGVSSIQLPWPVKEPALGVIETELLYPGQQALAESVTALVPVRR